MIVLTGGRQSGKTEALCRWMHERPETRCVIVADHGRAKYVLDRLHSGHLARYNWKPHVMTATDIQIGGYNRGYKHAFHFPEVCIDDLEDVFKVLFGVTLEFATMSATWIPLSPNNSPVKAEVIDPTLILERAAWVEPYIVDEETHFDPPRIKP
jgi:hypothetical protein